MEWGDWVERRSTWYGKREEGERLIGGWGGQVETMTKEGSCLGMSRGCRGEGEKKSRKSGQGEWRREHG